MTATTAPEAAIEIKYPVQRFASVAWTSPRTNRLLLEARGGYRKENYKYNAIDASDPRKRLITVTEQSSVNGAPANMQYHGGGIGGVTATQPYQNTNGRNYDVQFTASYITGAHAIKIGFNERIGRLTFNGFDHQPLSYRFNNGVPNQITQRAYPFTRRAKMDHDLGIFVQNKWTVDRLTLSYGARYDYKANSFPEQHVGPALLAPTRDITFPERENIAWMLSATVGCWLASHLIVYLASLAGIRLERDVAVDLVKRVFGPGTVELDRVYLGDITYIRTWEGWLYLATVIDLASRRVVGWSMADHMRADLVCDALKMALDIRRPGPGLVFHSDRGTQGGIKWSSQHLVMEVVRGGGSRASAG